MVRTVSVLISEIEHDLDEITTGRSQKEDWRIKLGISDARRDLEELRTAITEGFWGGRLYRCHSCGRIISEEQYVAEQEIGGGGYCHCKFSEGRTLIEMVEAKWWELLDWNQMEKTWVSLSEEIKVEIREARLAPDYDAPEETT